MPKSPRRPKALQGKIFRGRDAIDLGLLTRDDLRSSAWCSLFRGVYVDSAIAVTHRVRCLAASLYLLPPGAVVAGRSAARLYGVPFVADKDPVEVLVPPGFGARSGLIVHREVVPPAEWQQVGGHVGRVGGGTQAAPGEIVLTTPMRTCWDLARWLDLIEAVVFVDALLAKKLVTVASLLDYARGRTGSRGWRQLSRVAELADAASGSPQETRLRVRLVLCGVPTMVAQYVVTQSGQFVARVDLALPEYRIAIEYDGYWHGVNAQVERDRRRLNKLIGADWIVLHVTSQRMREDFDGVVREIRETIKKRS